MTAILAALVLAQPEAGDPRAGLAKLAKRIRDSAAASVVAIRIGRTHDPEGRGPRGRRAEHEDYYSRPQGWCTGTIVSSDGLVATTSFNTSGEISSVEVWIAGRIHPARLLGYDRNLDIALLKVEGVNGLPVLPEGSTRDLPVGSFSFVVGRTPDPETPTVNFGIVSALHRFGGTHLQTDAELAYGNAGGPLLDADGKLLGITTHIHPQARWGQSSGIGFALKIEEFRKVLPLLKAGRRVEKRQAPAAGAPSEAWLGIVPARARHGLPGALVEDVLPDSPAQKAGIVAGDVIVEFDGQAVESPGQLEEILRAHRPGNRVRIKVRRVGPDGREFEKEFEVELSKPEEY